MTVELAAEFTLAYECMECKRIYQRIPASRPVKPGEVSSGYCPDHLHLLEERWHGKVVVK